MKFTEIKHWSHPQHTLKLVPAKEPYRCNGCKEVGFRPCYECEYKECNFHLHEECAELQRESSDYHPFLKKCDFKLVENVQGERYCDACGKDVLGFVYQCSHTKAHDLHPCCMKLQHTLNGGEVRLYLKEKLSSKSKCRKCGRKEVLKDFKGWSYESNSGQHCYHVACVKDLILDNWKKDYIYGLNDVGQTSDTALQIMVPNKEDAVVQSGGISKNGKKVNIYWRKAKIVLKLIISAIFGDPIGIIAAICFESLFSS